MTEPVTTSTAPAADSSAPRAAATAARSKYLWLLLALAVPLATASYFVWQAWQPAPARDFAPDNADAPNLLQPDALIESQSLAALPKELLEIPLLRDVLTEDFVFYYEHNPDRLGLAGSLRRLAYEHELQLQDNLLNALLDEPAQVALWRGGKGKLSRVVLLLKRNGLSRMLLQLARVATSDSQLAEVALLQVDGEPVSVYRLRYAPGKAVLFASVDDQLLLLSQPELLLASDDDNAKQLRAASEQLEALLQGDQQWAEAFGLEENESRQRLTLSADYLAMGYRAFFPALAGFSLEKTASGWHSQLAYDPVSNEQAVDYQPLWRAMPMAASACVALPLAAEVPAKLLQRLGASAAQQQQLSAQLQGPLALCWYPTSRLYTPLLVTRITSGDVAALDATLGSLFAASVGSWEANHPQGRFPLQELTQANGRHWTRNVGSNFGQYPAAQLADPAQLAATGFFQVTLARHGDMLLFSLDDALVTQALATLDKRFPPLLDTLPQDQSVPLYLAPEKLAPLLQQEALASLPAQLEPVFRNAAETHLLPKLAALARYGKIAVALPPDTVPDERWQWLPLSWQAL